MEPTKNNQTGNDISAGGRVNDGATDFNVDANLEPVFRGMPKPGQPLTPTPKFTAQSSVSANAYSPASIPTAVPSSTSSSLSPSSFSAHTPSAMDRILNPNIASVPNPNLAPKPTPSPVLSSTSAMTSSQTPVVPPTPISSPTSSVSNSYPTSAQIPPAPSPSSSPTASSFKPYTPPVGFTSGYTVGAPLKDTPIKPQSSYPAPQSTSAFSKSTMSSVSVKPTTSSYVGNGIPAAPLASDTAARLNSEVNSIMQTKVMAKKSYTSTILIVVSILVLVALGGGGYYWYTYMYAPSKANDLNVNTQNPSDNPTSAFPSAVRNTPANPASSASDKSAVGKPGVTTPSTAKPTKVLTPFSQAQRNAVSAYIESNINKLSPVKSNSAYRVTDIVFDGPDRAIVQYTDGTNSYIAIAVASIDTSNTVKIVNFSLLDK